jgi:uncharacterized phage protein (TIGR02218 family)
MKTASTAVVNYLNMLRADSDAVAYIADCYTFWMISGLVLTYTNADLPITLNGYTYLASAILIDGLRYKSSTGLEVDQQQITISAKTTDTISGGVPFLQALRNGAFDGAEIQRERVFLNSWSEADRASPLGGVILFKGRVGTIDSIGRTTAQITVNSDLVLLDLRMPRNVYSPACQHVLYDSGCGANGGPVKSAYGISGSAGSGSTESLVNWTGAVSQLVQGTLTFSSGVLSGVSATIKSVVNGTSLTLAYPLESAPSPGDAFTAYWGCDHTQTTCTGRFNNLANFRGFRRDRRCTGPGFHQPSIRKKLSPILTIAFEPEPLKRNSEKLLAASFCSAALRIWSAAASTAVKVASWLPASRAASVTAASSLLLRFAIIVAPIL